MKKYIGILLGILVISSCSTTNEITEYIPKESVAIVEKLVVEDKVEKIDNLLESYNIDKPVIHLDNPPIEEGLIKKSIANTPKPALSKKEYMEEVIKDIKKNYPNPYNEILIADKDGIIYSENSKEVQPLASVTKLMTALLIIDDIRAEKYTLKTKVKVSNYASKIPYGIKLIYNKEYTVSDLLKAILIRSSNNAAYVLAEHSSSYNINAFAKRMNNKAKSLKMNKTFYDTPHGLPPVNTGRKMDVSNAEDIYKLSKYILSYPEILNIVNLKVAYIDGGRIKLESTNTLLGKVKGVNGLKTGYHKAAGNNISFYVNRDNKILFVIILGSNKPTIRDYVGKIVINKYYEY